ncbi:3'-5' exonuclease, partial [Enterobacter hormaechei]
KSTESEERRLFYVAMTRARDRLEMSTAKKNPTSRFVLEAGVSK